MKRVAGELFRGLKQKVAAVQDLEVAHSQGWKKEIPRFVFVFGNEAGDVDSLVSSLALSHCWNKLPQLRAGEEDSPSSRKEEDEVAIPVASFPRKDFRLRGDAKLLFSQAGFEFDEVGAPKDLVFIDDLPSLECLAGLESASRCSLALVDHNTKTKQVSSVFPNAQVVVIVDHHQDGGRHPDTRFKYIDTSCGSTCTLVAEMALNELVALPDELLTLLVGGILLDTRNFNPSSNRFNEVDVRVHDELRQAYPHIAMASDEQASLFSTLIDARFDTSSFSPADLLRMDFKVCNVSSGRWQGATIGFCSIMESIVGVVSKAGSLASFECALQDMCEENGFDALVAIARSEEIADFGKRKGVLIFEAGTTTKDGYSLEACIRSPLEGGELPDQYKEDALFVAQEIPTKGFDLQKWEAFTEGNLRTFHMRKAVTRKTLLPTVMETLNTEE